MPSRHGSGYGKGVLLYSIRRASSRTPSLATPAHLPAKRTDPRACAGRQPFNRKFRCLNDTEPSPGLIGIDRMTIEEPFFLPIGLRSIPQMPSRE
ncbi:MAG: hypothetical protein RLZZ163_354 [Actinomycetota bacterium]